MDLDQVVNQKIQKGDVSPFSPDKAVKQNGTFLEKQTTLRIWGGEVLKEFQNHVKTLEFLLPSFFYQITDERGNLKLPAHYLLPFNFSIQRGTDGMACVVKNDFWGQMFFQDPLTKKMQLIFLKGSE